MSRLILYLITQLNQVVCLFKRIGYAQGALVVRYLYVHRRCQSCFAERTLNYIFSADFEVILRICSPHLESFLMPIVLENDSISRQRLSERADGRVHAIEPACSMHLKCSSHQCKFAAVEMNS